MSSFIIFITIALTVYGLMNYYFIRKHNSIITARTLPIILIRLVIITLVIAPIAAIVFQRNDLSFMATISGFSGYSWLAFLFLFLAIHGTADIALFIAERCGFKPHPKTAKHLFLGTVLANILILLYGLYEAQSIGITRLDFTTDKLPAHVKELKIVQLSDVHFSSLTGTTMAEKLKNIIDSEQPDIAISTGDMLDRGIKEYDQVVKTLRAIDTPLGKYAITGNHEFYAGIDKSIAFHREAGFTMLRNRSLVVDETLLLVGVDDPAISRRNPEIILPPERDAFTIARPNLYTILLKHRPRLIEENSSLFDLQLSGHTHGGQIFPFSLIVRLVHPYFTGLYAINKHTRLYISRGTGTWGPPMRFLAPPEVTVISLQRAK